MQFVNVNSTFIAFWVHTSNAIGFVAYRFMTILKVLLRLFASNLRGDD
jgi:hypothetical protein